MFGLRFLPSGPAGIGVINNLLLSNEANFLLGLFFCVQADSYLPFSDQGLTYPFHGTLVISQHVKHAHSINRYMLECHYNHITSLRFPVTPSQQALTFRLMSN